LEIAERLLAYDVIVMMTTYSLSHTRARENACIKGTRVASMPEVEEGMFAPDGPMAADYQAIAMETMEIAKILTAGNQVRITTPFGTDLSFSIAGRMGESDSGILVQKGQFGNLPGGEAYIAPVEGTASGTLVVPEGWYPGLDVEMRMTFIDGYVSDVSGGGDVGIKFADIFAFHDEGKKHRRNCAELGVGTNPNAKRPDNVLEAEKIKGTVHVAVGDSSHLGGHTESDLHEDFVLAQPSVWIDGKKFIE
jgi:leucyl aminopeptidase (aminopeptidase T)